MLRRQWIWFIAAVLLIMAFPEANAAAAGGSSDDGGTVAEHFQKGHSPDGAGQKKQEVQNKQKAPLTTTSGTVWMFIKVILVLAVVVALIYFLLRFVNARTRSYSEGRSIQNVGGVSVGSNRSVQLVKIGGRVLVVGVGESVSLLKEIEDADEVGALLDENRQEDVIDHSIWKFRDWLKQTRTGNRQQGHFQKVLEDRLKQMGQDRKKALDEIKEKGYHK
ncbi:MAG TPA: flagellar biosynthetic protein FliO [Bacillales bacterium]|nr:flagellar biosynthetic protein FliO [Bacillales bacterium]